MKEPKRLKKTKGLVKLKKKICNFQISPDPDEHAELSEFFFKWVMGIRPMSKYMNQMEVLTMGTKRMNTKNQYHQPVAAAQSPNTIVCVAAYVFNSMWPKETIFTES